MHSEKLILAIIVAAAILLILESARWWLIRKLANRLGRQNEIQLLFVAPLMLNLVFVVLLPTLVYAALYPILPFTGYRSGFFIALFIFGVGQLPYHLRIQSQYRLSSALTAFDLFWGLLTLLIVIGAITHLYHY